MTNEANFIGMLNRIHHIGGLWHEFTYDQLWFKIHQERVIGTVLLALGLGWSLTLLVLIRTA